MRILVRILLHALTLISLLVCAAGAVLWPRSYTTEDDFEWRYAPDWPRTDTGTGWTLQVPSINGGIGFQWAPHAYNVPRPGLNYLYANEPTQTQAYPAGGVMHTDGRKGNGWRWRGFIYATLPATRGNAVFVTIPYWFLTPAAGLLPAVRLLRWFRRRRRRRKGPGDPTTPCPTCGYDLRATPDRCPECGHIPPTPSPSDL